MRTSTGFALVIGLYFLFSSLLWSAFHTAIMFFIAALLTAIAGLAIDRSLGGKKV